MIRWVAFLSFFLIGLMLVACVSGENSEVLLTPDNTLPPSTTVQRESPASISQVESAPATSVAAQIEVKTDSELYREGESIIITIGNNSPNPVIFTENCSLNLCFESGEDWICLERECDGPRAIIEPGSQLEILQEAQSMDPPAKADARSRYKLDYQLVSEEPYFFAHSNEFTVQGGGLNCEQAKRFALEHAQASPYWNDIDASRATVRWQDENQTCMVDFAWQGAEQIRTGLWAEGYFVIVGARFGQVIEANAYER